MSVCVFMMPYSSVKCQRSDLVATLSPLEVLLRMTWKVATLWAFGLCALQGTLAEEGGGGAYPEYKVDGPQPKEVPHPDPYKAKEGENVLAVPLQPLNPFGEIKGDDVDKGGDVTKACRYHQQEGLMRQKKKDQNSSFQV